MKNSGEELPIATFYAPLTELYKKVKDIFVVFSGKEPLKNEKGLDRVISLVNFFLT